MYKIAFTAANASPYINCFLHLKLHIKTRILQIVCNFLKVHHQENPSTDKMHHSIKLFGFTVLI
jgi:hypothetical protein